MDDMGTTIMLKSSNEAVQNVWQVSNDSMLFK